jgi:hypothetical protein
MEGSGFRPGRGNGAGRDAETAAIESMCTQVQISTDQTCRRMCAFVAPSWASQWVGPAKQQVEQPLVSLVCCGSSAAQSACNTSAAMYVTSE